jgi:toluene monooxygenase system ferredoxin subunit
MSAAQMTQLRPTINIDDLWEGDMTAVTVDDTSVLLVNVDGEVRAYENRCPHQAAALAEGDFDGVTITCIRHLWQFDADTGCGVNPATARLTPYPCQVAEDGTILVDASG